MASPGKVTNRIVPELSAPNNKPLGEVRILVGDGTKPAHLHKALLNNEAGVSIIIPGNLSTSTIQKLITFFKDIAIKFRITRLEVADKKLILTLEAAVKAKQSTMVNAGFQIAGGAVSGVWVGGAMRRPSGAAPSNVPGKPGSPGAGKLPESKIDTEIPFSMALDNPPPSRPNFRTRDDFSVSNGPDVIADGRGGNLHGHIQMAQGAQAVIGGIGGMWGASLQQQADTRNAESSHLDHVLSFLQELISQNENNANNVG